MKYFAGCFMLVFWGSISISAQQDHGHRHNHAGHIEFPDIPGYITLTCDFHIHSVFSDGHVWPSIRVEEAVKDGLDAISLTEHLEYQPHADDMPHPDRNRAYEIAEELARPYDLIVVKGSEITRDMPPGHANAIFIQDANKLLIEDSIEVFREAKRQGAFVFWNHPNWIAQYRDGIAKLTDVHKYLLEEKLLDGIEVVNDRTYSDEALQIALDYDLTIMGTSDIHGLVDWQYNIAAGGHRPVTLVMAEARTSAGIHEALKQNRTIVWFNDLLVGRENMVKPLLESSMVVKGVAYQGPSSLAIVTLENKSDAPFILKNKSSYTLHRHADIVNVPPQSEFKLEVKTLEQKSSFELEFEVLNAVVAPQTHPVIKFTVNTGL